MPLKDEDIKQLIAILQKGLTNDASDDNIKATNKAVKPVQKKTKNKVKTQKYINKFDEMLEKNLHKDDIEFDKKVTKLPPVPRTRSFKPIEIQCRSCGKKESVNPNYIDSVERYKCNKCCANPG
jgi:hypothetical protein